MSDQLAPVVADEIERRLDEVWDRLRALGYDGTPEPTPTPNKLDHSGSTRRSRRRIRRPSVSRRVQPGWSSAGGGGTDRRGKVVGAADLGERPPAGPSALAVDRSNTGTAGGEAGPTPPAGVGAGARGACTAAWERWVGPRSEEVNEGESDRSRADAGPASRAAVVIPSEARFSPPPTVAPSGCGTAGHQEQEGDHDDQDGADEDQLHTGRAAAGSDEPREGLGGDAHVIAA